MIESKLFTVAYTDCGADTFYEVVAEGSARRKAIYAALDALEADKMLSIINGGCFIERRHLSTIRAKSAGFAILRGYPMLRDDDPEDVAFELDREEEDYGVAGNVVFFASDNNNYDEESITAEQLARFCNDRMDEALEAYADDDTYRFYLDYEDLLSIFN